MFGNHRLKDSKNSWDWLGPGAYFWENSASRAMEFAIAQGKRADSSIKEPAVLGAALDLVYCLDLLDYKNLSLLKTGYEILEATTSFRISPKQNSQGNANNDLLIRDLDCAVIEAIYKLNKDEKLREFDSVRGVFWEEPPLYPNAGFREKDHIQICIRNPNCINFNWTGDDTLAIYHNGLDEFALVRI